MEQPFLPVSQLRDLLLRNWMTHDALWYAEVAAGFGMAVASPMNLRVCRKLGQLEFVRLMKAAGASPPRSFKDYRTLFELAREVFVPDFMVFGLEYPGGDRQVFHMRHCFAHDGMQKAGCLPEYECGIFERMEGWFDAMGLRYERNPDLKRCPKLAGNDCRVELRFDFGHPGD